jgi:hypothetical protein
MASHTLTLKNIPAVPIGKADVIFEIKANQAMLGKLRVSRGAVVWFPKSGKKSYKMSWAKFDALMQESGTKGNDSAAI